MRLASEVNNNVGIYVARWQTADFVLLHARVIYVQLTICTSMVVHLYTLCSCRMGSWPL